MAKFYSEDPEYTKMTIADLLLRNRIHNILESNNIDLSNSHWHGSNYGVPENAFEDVAEEIMTELGLWEKEDD